MRPSGELGGGELVEVGVGDADVDDVRADIGDVDGKIAGDGLLEREVPLLDVAGVGGAVDGVDGLAEASVLALSGDGVDGGAAATARRRR